MNNTSVTEKLTGIIADIQRVRDGILLDDEPSLTIGIGITTQNRGEVFTMALSHIYNRSKGCKIVIVDDASTRPVNVPTDVATTFRFNTVQGIAAAKNKCFELLEDCEHIFLFDDDTWPLVDNWYLPYINSREPHLMYIFQDFSTSTKLNDTKVLYKDSTMVAYTHARGCMCYFKRVCLEKAGGMYTGFGRWGYEHPDLSNRIYNQGLTTFRYMDVVDSNKLIYSLDEHEKVQSTVPATGAERQTLIRRNKPIYDARINSNEFIPYKVKEDIILTCYFNTVADPQRGEKWKGDVKDIDLLISSLHGMKAVILTDCLHPNCTNVPNVKIVQVETAINPYFQRWVSYKQYIQDHKDSLRYVFCVDATDVEVLRNPFPRMHPGVLYTGDEVDALLNEWMYNHHKHPTLLDMYQNMGALQILNAGLCGGDTKILIEFMTKLIDFYSTCEEDAFKGKVPNAGLTDMGAFNYVARNYFYDSLQHGTQINTRFKANEKNNISWFKHK